MNFKLEMGSCDPVSPCLSRQDAFWVTQRLQPVCGHKRTTCYPLALVYLLYVVYVGDVVHIDNVLYVPYILYVGALCTVDDIGTVHMLLYVHDLLILVR